MFHYSKEIYSWLAALENQEDLESLIYLKYDAIIVSASYMKISQLCYVYVVCVCRGVRVEIMRECK